MEAKVVSRRVVKPFKLTPTYLGVYKICLMDEVNPSMHVMRLLYYESAKQLHLLEESLAQVLSMFYPLAGRYDKEKHHVVCSDQGAEYAVAEVDYRLSQLMAAVVVPEDLNRLLPLDIYVVDEPEDPMLVVQINRFQCGGVAIGICTSHRILDSASLGIFLAARANAASGGSLKIWPDFDSPNYFPSENLRPIEFQASRIRDRSIVSKMFRFNRNAISSLRDRLREEWKTIGSRRPPSRVVLLNVLYSTHDIEFNMFLLLTFTE